MILLKVSLLFLVAGVVNGLTTCANQTCSGHGTCVNTTTIGYLKCNCTSNYTGLVCDRDLDYCGHHPNPCANGVCISEPKVYYYTCACPSGWVDELCSTPDPCPTFVCPNGGTCLSDPISGAPSCQCAPGWTGFYCDTALDACTPDPCVNGLCRSIEFGTQFVCDCYSEFYGTTCNTSCPAPTVASSSTEWSEPCSTGKRPSIYSFGSAQAQAIANFCPSQTFYAVTDLSGLAACPGALTPQPACNGSSLEYIGCSYSAGVNPFEFGFLVAPPRTHESCRAGCFARGFKYMFVGYDYCMCSNKVFVDISPARTTCTIPCSGESSQMCGGSYFDYSFYCVSGGNPCDLRPCKNNGKCAIDPVSNWKAVCTCKPGWIGKFCQTVDPCFPDPCVNGLCRAINSGTQTACDCYSDFYGDACDIPCPPLPVYTDQMGEWWEPCNYTRPYRYSTNNTVTVPQGCVFQKTYSHPTGLGCRADYTVQPQCAGASLEFLSCNDLGRWGDFPAEYVASFKPMSQDRCRAICFEAGYKYMIIQWDQWCGCANTLFVGVDPTNTACYSACWGNPSQTCGRSNVPWIFQSNCVAGGTPCDLHPCKNGGVCSTDPVSNWKAVCTCKPGSNGTRCEYIDYCYGVQCAATGGRCVVSSAKVGYCACYPGYTGSQCESNWTCDSTMLSVAKYGSWLSVGPSYANKTINYTCSANCFQFPQQTVAPVFTCGGQGSPVSFQDCTPTCTGTPIFGDGSNVATVSLTAVGTNIPVSCASGFAFSNPTNPNALCSAINTWTITGSCLRVCLTSGQFGGGSIVGTPTLTLSTFALVNATVSISCQSGYVLNGSSIATCTSSGTWVAASAPYCNVINCTNIFLGQSGTLSSAAPFHAGYDVTFTCYPGFYNIPEASSVTTYSCDINGNWTKSFIVCKESCVQLQSLGDAFYAPTSPFNAVGTVVNITCAPGYVFYGNVSKAVCQSGGNWAVGGVCIQTCPDISSVFSNGVDTNLLHTTPSFMVSGQAAIGATVTLSCPMGYNFIGQSSTFVCVGGYWTFSYDSSCYHIPCQDLFGMHYGTLAPSGLYYANDTVTYTCPANNYAPISNSVATVYHCNWNGTWNKAFDECKQTCPILTVANGTVTVSPAISNVLNQPPLDSISTYHCQTGFKLSGPLTVTCTSGVGQGYWPTTSTCDRIICDPTPFASVSGSFALGGSYLSLTSYNFSCYDNYVDPVLNIKTLQYACLANGSWDKVPINCVETCDSLVNPIPNGGFKFIPVPNNILGRPLLNTIAAFSCQSGFDLSGSANLTCNSGVSGKWMYIPSCVQKTCTYDQFFMLYGTLDSNGPYYSHTSYNFTCNKNYVDPVKNVTWQRYTCLDDRTWDKAALTCTETCDQIAPVVSGSFVLSQPTNNILGRPTVGTTATFTCQSGYELSSASTASCQSGASWSTIPTCSRMTCPSTQFMSISGSLDNGGPYNSHTTYNYTCTSGYFDPVNNINSQLYTCQDNRTWNKPAPVCTATCAVPSTLGDGLMSIAVPNNLLHRVVQGDSVTLACQPAYTLNGPSSAMCNGLDSMTISTTCKRTECNPMVFIGTGGVVAAGPYYAGLTYAYNCSASYFYAPSNTLTTTYSCLNNGSWDKTFVPCTATCSPTIISIGDGLIFTPPAINNILNRAAAGATSTLSCATGYNISIGSPTAVCGTDGNWAIATTCTRAQCSDQFIKTTGFISPAPYYSLNSYTYICNENFTHFPENSSIVKYFCSATGQWDKPFNVCIGECITRPTFILPLIQVGDIANLTMGVAVKGSSMAILKCDVGYTMSGTGTASCMDAGVWNVDATCIRNNCSSSYFSSTGIVAVPTTPPYNSLTPVVFNCNPNTFDQQNNIITQTYQCQANGTFDKLPLNCIGTCAVPAALGSGVVAIPTPNNILQRIPVGSSVNLACVNGYDLIGSATATCLDLDSFNMSATCQRRVCADVFNGSVGGTVPAAPYLSGQSYVYTCAANYFYAPTNTLTTTYSCSLNGTWNSPFIPCTATCLPLITLGDGVVASAPATNNIVGRPAANATSTLSCSSGYTFTGSSPAVCGNDGNWTIQGGCTRNICVDQFVNTTGSIVASPYYSLLQYTFTCAQYYMHFPENATSVTYSCSASGQWSKGFTPCTSVCLSQPPISSPLSIVGQISNLTSGVAILDSVANLTCAAGYSMIGSGTSTCSAGGNWSTSAACQRINCSDTYFATSNGGLTDASPYLSLTTHTFNCNQYTLEPTLNIITLQYSCLANGSWDKPAITCVDTCAVPVVLGSGGLPLQPPNNILQRLVVGSSITVTCQNGYQTAGSANATCTALNTLSPIATCQRMTCTDVFSNVPGGNVTTPGPFYAGFSVTYNCSPNFLLLAANVVSTNYSCLINGTWDKPFVNCTETCAQFVTAGSGVVPVTAAANNILQRPIVTSTVILACNSGYSLNATGPAAMCLAGGFWLVPGICQRNICPSTFTNATGTAAVGPYLSNTPHTFTCLNNFVLMPENVSSVVYNCLANGTWDRVFHECTETCDLPIFAGDGAIPPTVVINNVLSRPLVGSNISLSCQPGYTLNTILSPPVAYCVQGGQWALNNSFCQRNLCPNSTVFTNGSGTISSVGPYLSNTPYSFNCADGLLHFPENSNQTVFKCDINGNWTTDVTPCLGYCTKPTTFGLNVLLLNISGIPVNATIIGIGYNAYLGCTPGYQMLTSGIAQCQQNQSWTIDANCSRIQCQDQFNNSGGNITAGPYLSNVSYTYTCPLNTLFLPINAISQSYKCNLDGSWDKQFLPCNQTCAIPATAGNGVKPILFNSSNILGRMQVGESVNLACNPGYTLNGSSPAICGPIGMALINAVCNRINCADVFTATNATNNGSIVAGPYLSGVVYSFNCNANYLNARDNLVNTSYTCGLTGQWSKNFTACSETCGSTWSNIVGGSGFQVPINNAIGRPVVGQTVNVSCALGYNTIGTNRLATCLTGGNYTLAAPSTLSCQSYQCPSIFSNATGSIVSGPYIPGAVYTFKCNPKYIYVAGNAYSYNLLCQTNQTWNMTFTPCAATCAPLLYGGNGTIRTNYNSLKRPVTGTSITVTCKPNYFLRKSSATSSVVVCNGGHWSNLPRCESTTCVDASNYPNPVTYVADKIPMVFTYPCNLRSPLPYWANANCSKSLNPGVIVCPNCRPTDIAAAWTTNTPYGIYNNTCNIKPTNTRNRTASLPIGCANTHFSERLTFGTPAAGSICSGKGQAPSCSGPGAYIGCYTPGVGVNVMYTELDFTMFKDVTVETCISYCYVNKYSYAAIQGRAMCACSNFIYANITGSPAPIWKDESACSFSCKNSLNLKCGGPAAKSFYCTAQKA